MNILIVTALYPGYENESSSNVPYVVHYFAKEWKKYGHNVQVINTRLKYPNIFNIAKKIKAKNIFQNIYEYTYEGIDICRVPITTYPRIGCFKNENKKNLKYIQQKFKEKNFKPDIIVEHMLIPSLFLVDDLKKIYNTPVILCIHKGDFAFLRDKLSCYRFKKINNYIDAYAFRNKLLMNEFKDSYSNFLSKKESFIANSGISSKDIIRFEDKSMYIKQHNTINIITVATLIKRKNIDSIIDAFYMVRKNYNNVILTVIGIGEELNYLKRQAEKLNIDRYIKFIGEISRFEVMNYLEKSDIFALISNNETLGMVYLEAMSKGCITIGSKNEGIDGIIKDGENGFLCEAGNAKELYNIFNKIILMENCKKNKIIENSIDTIQNFTEEKVSKEYLDYIIKIYHEKGQKI